MMVYEKCPKCGMKTKTYNDYGVEYEICTSCGWDERDEFMGRVHR